MKGYCRVTGKTFTILRVSELLRADKLHTPLKTFVCQWDDSEGNRFWMDEVSFNNTCILLPEEEKKEVE